MNNIYNISLGLNIKVGDILHIIGEELTIMAVVTDGNGPQLICENVNGEKIVVVPEICYRPIPLAQTQETDKIIKFPRGVEW